MTRKILIISSGECLKISLISFYSVMITFFSKLTNIISEQTDVLSLIWWSPHLDVLTILDHCLTIKLSTRIIQACLSITALMSPSLLFPCVLYNYNYSYYFFTDIVHQSCYLLQVQVVCTIKAKEINYFPSDNFVSRIEQRHSLPCWESFL